MPISNFVTQVVCAMVSAGQDFHSDFEEFFDMY